MKTKLIAIITLLLIAFSTGWAWSDPGPYPVIFVHGANSEADPDDGFWTWKATSAAMKEILDEGYANYQAGDPRDCKINTTLNPTTGSPLDRVRRIYNFSYYNTDNSKGVIGDADGQFYPVKTQHDIRSDYMSSADNACWAEHLADFVDDVLVATGADKVSLVCHSMGGLVVRDAITFYGCEDKVYKVLMVGTPNHGFTGWGGGKSSAAGLQAGKISRNMVKCWKWESECTRLTAARSSITLHGLE